MNRVEAAPELEEELLEKELVDVLLEERHWKPGCRTSEHTKDKQNGKQKLCVHKF